MIPVNFNNVKIKIKNIIEHKNLKLRDIGEFGWINRVRSRVLQGRSGILAGIGDDSAWIKSQGSLLITCDLLIENVHFLKDIHPPRLLGRKALSVNLSDIAAMSGIPQYALVAIGFPQDTELEYADELMEGFLEVAVEHKVELIGGDTTASEKLCLSITVFGKPAHKKPVLRSGAKPGDDIWVTGTLGDASLGFELLKKSQTGELDLSDFHHSSLLVKHFDPDPRVEAGIMLGKIANSMIDLSDGLISDLGHILEESGKKTTVKAEVYLDKLPISKDFKEYFKGNPLDDENGLSLVLTGGEDYELLFTAKQSSRSKILEFSRKLDLPISRVGRIKKGKKAEVILRDEKARKVKHPRLKFEHFPSQERQMT